MAARYPAAVATEADLKIAANQVQSALVSPITATDMTLTVRDGSRFQANMLLSIDKEILWAGAVTGNQIAIAQRAFDGTGAAAHAANAVVSVFIDAWHHNQPSAEIIAIENFLGPNGQNLSSFTAASSTFIFTPQSPGGALIPGLNVITLTPVPRGVNGANQNHWLYISGGTGAPEAVLIEGGTAVSGAASGTVIVDCANAHSGAWTIGTATSGIEEAIQSVIPAGGGTVMVPAGQWDIFARITVPWKVMVQGVNRYASIIRNQTTNTTAFRLDAPFDLDLTKAMGITHLTIVGSALGRTTVDVDAPAVYLYGAGSLTLAADVTIKNHNVGIHIAGAIYAVVERFEIAVYGLAGIYVEYGDGNWIRTGLISNNALTTPQVPGSAGIYMLQFGGLYVQSVDITKAVHAVKFQPPSGKACNYGFFTDVLADSSTNHGWYFDTSLGGGINTIQCIDCWASFCGINFDGLTWNTGRGIFINGTVATLSGVTFIGGRSRLSGGNGVDILGGAFIKIIGMEINANSQESNNSYSGISLGTAVQHVLITHNQIGNFQVGPANQRQAFGIIASGGATPDFLVIRGNDLIGNNISPLGILGAFAASASIIIDGNLGVDGFWVTLPAAATFSSSLSNDLHKITGTAAISTITGGWSGRRIVLVFTDAAPGGLVTGGNIAKAVTAAQNQKLTGEFDGTSWYFS